MMTLAHRCHRPLASTGTSQEKSADPVPLQYFLLLGGGKLIEVHPVFHLRPVVEIRHDALLRSTPSQPRAAKSHEGDQNHHSEMAERSMVISQADRQDDQHAEIEQRNLAPPSSHGGGERHAAAAEHRNLDDPIAVTRVRPAVYPHRHGIISEACPT